MARALSDILTELKSTYDPQRQRATDFYNQSIGTIDPQEGADLSGLEQAKKNAFSSIETGANRRGLFFSGVPIEEQAKYVGESYLPSIASLKGRYAGIRGDLRNTLAQQLQNIDLDERKFGQGIYQNEMDMNFQREQAAAAERASRAASAAANAPFQFGRGATTTGRGGNVQGVATGYTPQLQQLYNSMFFKPGGGTWSDQDLMNDYNATAKSAARGNRADMQKLDIYHSARPELFGTAPQGGLSASIVPYREGVRIPQTYNWQQNAAPQVRVAQPSNQTIGGQPFGLRVR